MQDDGIHMIEHQEIKDIDRRPSSDHGLRGDPGPSRAEKWIGLAAGLCGRRQLSATCGWKWMFRKYLEVHQQITSSHCRHSLRSFLKSNSVQHEIRIAQSDHSQAGHDLAHPSPPNNKDTPCRANTLNWCSTLQYIAVQCRYGRQREVSV